MNTIKNRWLMIIGLFVAVVVNPLYMSGLAANQCPITLVGHGHHGHHGHHGDRHGGWGESGHGHGHHEGGGHHGGHGGGHHH
ncbi:MAG: hypothetical protein LLF94_11525 [Chlamydiales bacterium]|nr:hypothetical protein [Chlamydiales bacterium]